MVRLGVDVADAAAADAEHDGLELQVYEPEAVGQAAPAPTAGPSPEQNSRYRQRGLNFVSAGGLDELPVLRVVMEPLRALLHDMLDMRSAAWEAAQRQKFCNVGVDDVTPLRQYRLVVCAAGTLEATCQERLLGALWSEVAWSAVHPVCISADVCVDAFTMLTRYSREVVGYNRCFNTGWLF